MKRMATLMSAMTQPSAKGITAQATMASTRDSIGARKNTGRSTPAGMTISFSTYFSASATDCRMPQGPTTFGPRRICTAAQTLRSPQTRNSRLIITNATTRMA